MDIRISTKNIPTSEELKPIKIRNYTMNMLRQNLCIHLHLMKSQVPALAYTYAYANLTVKQK